MVGVHAKPETRAYRQRKDYSFHNFFSSVPARLGCDAAIFSSSLIYLFIYFRSSWLFIRAASRFVATFIFSVFYFIAFVFPGSSLLFRASSGARRGEMLCRPRVHIHYSMDQFEFGPLYSIVVGRVFRQQEKECEQWRENRLAMLRARFIISLLWLLLFRAL